MSIAKYVENFRWGLVELKGTLPLENVDPLRSVVSDMTTAGWADFVRDNAGVISDFLISTPSRRRNLKKFQGRPVRECLILASAQRMKAACVFAEEAMVVEFVGQSYQKASAMAAGQYDNIASFCANTYWPFDRHPPAGFFFDPNEFLL